MYDIIEKLLVLQDRDRKILRVREQLTRIGPERESFRAQASEASSILEAAKQRSKQIESDRKQRELDVEAKKEQIGKYSLQQFQTKKNEEYRALAHQIETCRADITTLEDAQLSLMEQAEAAQRDFVAATRQADEIKKLAQGKLQDLDGLEKSLTGELAELEADREQLKGAVDPGALNRYERLIKLKGGNVVVGIQHGVCGGCHMRFPTQVLVTCQAGREIVTCPNCGRILYYSSDMDLAVID
jgi:predicted  nucleic acid-binding Zn-ribbon protein